VERVLEQFRGTVLQKPPVFSALKQGGETAYRKARRGEEVELAPRPVTFRRIELVEFAPPDRVRLHVRCSAGAYIRSLAHELGGALGTAATLMALRRTGAGPFRADDAVTLADLEHDAAHGALAGRMLPPGTLLDLPALSADDDVLRRLGFGQEVTLAQFTSAGPDGSASGSPGELRLVEGDVAQVIDAHGALAGIVRRVHQTHTGESTWRADKWFYSESDADIQ
jgi:tRNA pseudouridine55 synthase